MLLYTQSLSLALFPNGGYILCIVILPQLGGHGYMIIVMEYFKKLAEEIPTYSKDGNTTTLFLFNHVIARFGVPQAIVIDHGSHFRNQMMDELNAKLGFQHENSTPYYPHANVQVDAINKVLKNMLHRMVGDHKSNWHQILFSAL